MFADGQFDFCSTWEERLSLWAKTWRANRNEPASRGRQILTRESCEMFFYLNRMKLCDKKSVLFTITENIEMRLFSSEEETLIITTQEKEENTFEQVCSS